MDYDNKKPVSGELTGEPDNKSIVLSIPENVNLMQPLTSVDSPVRIERDLVTGEERMSAPADGRYAIRDLDYVEDVADRIRWRDHEQEYYTKCNMDTIRDGLSDIPKSYLSHLLYLQTFIDYKGVLRLANNHHMSRGDMLNMLDISERSHRDFMKCMIKHDIIRSKSVSGKKVYGINPRYHLRGESNNERMVKAFIDEIRKLYQNHHAHEEIAAIYKLLPYVHMRNALVTHPYEQDVKEAEPLTLDQIAAIVDVNVKSVYKFMKNLKLGNEYVFESTDGGGTYWINPRIVWRQSTRPDQTLLDIFALKRMAMDRRAGRRSNKSKTEE